MVLGLGALKLQRKLCRENKLRDTSLMEVYQHG